MKNQPLALSTLIFLAQFSFAQNIEPFTAHEWGTFTTLQTSNGKLLSGLQKDEERLPYFVHNICFCADDDKGWINYAHIDNVTVKMETPVIYFYSDVSRAVNVKVELKQGSISQWYPARIAGEQNPVPHTSATSMYSVDFSEPRTGWIEWNAAILAPDDTSRISSNPHYETEQWVRPRATASNLIKVENSWNHLYDEVEKFLFYRGIAGFEVPVKVEFNNTGKLVITNNFQERLNYVMVYEKKPGMPANIWWSGTLGTKNVKVLSKPDYQMNEKELQAEMKHFENALVNEGLYRDEAAAMLNTWKESYFEHEGLKVFWVVPRSFIDEVLPININPQPDNLERVIVGRSEVLTPEFELELMQGDEDDFYTKWGEDRFVLAYEQLRTEGIPAEWSSIDKDIIDEVTGANSIYVYPNPAGNKIHFSGSFSQSENINIRVINSNGSEVYSRNESAESGLYSSAIDLSAFADGIYVVLFQSGEKKQTLKFIKAE